MLANSELAKRRAFEQLLGVRIPEGMCKREKILALGLLTETQYVDVQERVYTDPAYLHLMEPVAGVTEALKTLTFDGHQLSVITSRGGAFFENACAWMKRQGWEEIPVIGVGKGNSKAPEARRLALEAFVDDDLWKLTDLVGIVPHLFHFSWPYNRDADPRSVGATRVNSWKELVRNINQLHLRRRSAR